MSCASGCVCGLALTAGTGPDHFGVFVTALVTDTSALMVAIHLRIGIRGNFTLATSQKGYLFATVATTLDALGQTICFWELP